MTPRETEELASRVLDLMAKFVDPRTTPIVVETVPNQIQMHGTGNYVQINHHDFVLQMHMS